MVWVGGVKNIEKSSVRSVDPNPIEDVFFCIFSCWQTGWTYGPINGFMLGIDSHILRFSPSGQNRMVQIPQGRFRGLILLMEEILHQLICSLSHYLQGFTHPRWYRISSINSMDCLPCSFSIHVCFFKDELMTKLMSRKLRASRGVWVFHAFFLLDEIEPAN